MSITKYNNKGFTMVELIMVILILGTMIIIGVSKYPGAQKSAHDEQRKSDLKQYQTALEGYANRNNGLYPSWNNQKDITDLCSDLQINDCPADIYANSNRCNGICGYYYSANGSCNDGTACATQYVLYSRLERETDFWVFCSNGSSALVGEGSDFTDGNCPLI